MTTYTLVFDGVAADDLALCFPPLEAAVAELEALAVSSSFAGGGSPPSLAYVTTVRASIARLAPVMNRLKAINRG
jgi:hypothetical protein